MKFLCIECDEPMKLITTSDSSDGALNVIFQCPNCSKEIAMLTNAMETQMVRSMDVKIGGKEKNAEPMGKLRSSLISGKEKYEFDSPSDSENSAGDPLPTSESTCPFPGMINEMENQQSAKMNEIHWTDGARERMQRVPDFVRAMVSKSIEKHAKEQGYSEINETVLDEVKGSFGM